LLPSSCSPSSSGAGSKRSNGKMRKTRSTLCLTKRMVLLPMIMPLWFHLLEAISCSLMEQVSPSVRCRRIPTVKAMETLNIHLLMATSSTVRVPLLPLRLLLCHARAASLLQRKSKVRQHTQLLHRLVLLHRITLRQRVEQDLISATR